MHGLKAILTTLLVVFAALCTALIVLATIWLIANFNVDRILTVVGILISATGLLFALVIHSRRRR